MLAQLSERVRFRLDAVPRRCCCPHCCSQCYYWPSVAADTCFVVAAAVVVDTCSQRKAQAEEEIVAAVRTCLVDSGKTELAVAAVADIPKQRIPLDRTAFVDSAVVVGNPA